MDSIITVKQADVCVVISGAQVRFVVCRGLNARTNGNRKEKRQGAQISFCTTRRVGFINPLLMRTKQPETIHEFPFVRLIFSITSGKVWDAEHRQSLPYIYARCCDKFWPLTYMRLTSLGLFSLPQRMMRAASRPRAPQVSHNTNGLYALMARPACATENPCRVIYNARNGMTKVPNLLRKVPKKSIQTGRGNARNLTAKVVRFSVINGELKTPPAYSLVGSNFLRKQCGATGSKSIGMWRRGVI